ncbi:hypothetical protein L9F63_002491, partial [Diploptera punctata]
TFTAGVAMMILMKIFRAVGRGHSYNAVYSNTLKNSYMFLVIALLFVLISPSYPTRISPLARRVDFCGLASNVSTILFVVSSTAAMLPIAMWSVTVNIKKM